MIRSVRLGPARVLFTDRHGGPSGGCSRPPYATANLAHHVGDDAMAVAENRRRVAADAGLPDPASWCVLDQRHGGTVVVVDEAGTHGAPPPVADGAVTACPGVTLVVLTADCAPVALAVDDAVGVVHAGWRGLLAGIVGTAVATIRAVGTGSPRALIGPCIQPARYAFGRHDLDTVVARLGPEVATRTAAGEPALDLPGAVRAALAHEGVAEVADVGICTAGDPNWFSFRRDGTTGRQATIVVMDGSAHGGRAGG